MAGYQNFQVQRNKQTRKHNLFERGHNNRKPQSKSERLMSGVGEWTAYYRANPQRAAKDLLGIDLKIFQQILLYIMMHFHFLSYIAARGLLSGRLIEMENQ